VVAEEDLLTLRSVGPAVSKKIIKKQYIIKQVCKYIFYLEQSFVLWHFN